MLCVAGTNSIVNEQQSPPPMDANKYRTDAEQLSVRHDVLVSTPTLSQQSAAYQLKLGSWGACSTQCGGGAAGLRV